MLHTWPYQLKEQREEQLLQRKVCVDWGVELSSRIHVTGHENDQPIASMNCMWGVHVSSCVWVSSGFCHLSQLCY